MPRSGRRGATILFTGLSGAGKSTLAAGVEEAFVRSGRPAFLLDGDNLRHGLNGDLGFSDRDRTENVRRAGEVARMFAEAGSLALIALICPFEEDRRLIRALHEEAGLAFAEIFVDTSLEECERRDPKGLYARARAGQLPGFTGIDSAYEVPAHPDLVRRPRCGVPPRAGLAGARPAGRPAPLARGAARREAAGPAAAHGLRASRRRARAVRSASASAAARRRRRSPQTTGRRHAAWSRVCVASAVARTRMALDRTSSAARRCVARAHAGAWLTRDAELAPTTLQWSASAVDRPADRGFGCGPRPLRRIAGHRPQATRVGRQGTARRTSAGSYRRHVTVPRSPDRRLRSTALDRRRRASARAARRIPRSSAAGEPDGRCAS